ncbi:hypothetical protein [Mycobacteroides abscessus]|uniref:hypothetical protein n=1 Tax=Mycobacteroides abscessus TaxID=36809 RepID=UPI0011C4A8E7|nr:hypothetical protein [Mycobacteroides abscessus]
MGQPQLQVGHFYLVFDSEYRTEIRPYMHDGWYPAHPHPAGMLCEMSRTHHPDNVEMPDEIEIADWEHAFITRYCPPVADEPLIAQGIRGFAQAIYQANTGNEWNWAADDQDKLKRQLDFLIIAARFVNDIGGNNPTIRGISDVIATDGMPLGIFRPRHWPRELQPGATPLPYTESAPADGNTKHKDANTNDAKGHAQAAQHNAQHELQTLGRIAKSLAALEQNAADESPVHADAPTPHQDWGDASSE